MKVCTQCSENMIVLVLMVLVIPLAEPMPAGGPWPMDSTSPRVEEYGVVVDAGSSGSRARVYTWSPHEDPSKVPDISQVRFHY